MLVARAGVVDDADADRDTWTTPRKLARAIGRVWLDPCSNERSVIDAERTFELERRGQDALVLARFVPRNPPGLVFINPPYSRGNVVRFVDAFAHTRFCFLVRFDPSTDWFARLWQRSQLACFLKERVEFDPPPGVPPPPSNPYPHALFYARAEDATAAIRRLCYVTQLIKETPA